MTYLVFPTDLNVVLFINCEKYPFDLHFLYMNGKLNTLPVIRVSEGVLGRKGKTS